MRIRVVAAVAVAAVAGAVLAVTWGGAEFVATSAAFAAASPAAHTLSSLVKGSRGQSDVCLLAFKGLDAMRFRRKHSADLEAAAAGDGTAWRRVAAAFDSDPDLQSHVLIVGSANGTVLLREAPDGSLGADDKIRVMGASQWVSAVTLMRLARLRGSPAIWTNDTLATPVSVLSPAWVDRDPTRRATLRNLLAMTSGLDTSAFPTRPRCADGTRGSWADCARLAASSLDWAPGQTFTFGPGHSLVAGEALVRGAGADAGQWDRLFDEVMREPLGWDDAVAYDGAEHAFPDLTTGLTISTSDYAGFLRALLGGRLLPPKQARAALSDQTAGADMARSPMAACPSVHGGAWGYGLGCWLECEEHSAPNTCGAEPRASAPGVLGFYPSVNPRTGTFVILAGDGMQDVKRGIAAVLAVLSTTILLLCCCCCGGIFVCVRLCQGRPICPCCASASYAPGPGAYGGSAPPGQDARGVMMVPTSGRGRRQGGFQRVPTDGDGENDRAGGQARARAQVVAPPQPVSAEAASAGPGWDASAYRGTTTVATV